MTNKTWYKYSERRPTKADARDSMVLRSAGQQVILPVIWDENYTFGYWRRLYDDDFPPKEHKLHPAWQPIDADTGYKNGDYILNPPPRGKADI